MASVSILLSRTAPSQIIVGTLDGNGISSSVEEERLHSHFPEQTGPLT
jgi:hypothetical protein